MIAWLLRLYPRAWRRRYGDEFVALLEGRRLTPTVVFDVARGALDAHRRARGATMGGSGGARFWRQWVALHASVGLVTGLVYFLVPGILIRSLPPSLSWPFGYPVDRWWYIGSVLAALGLLLLLIVATAQWRLLRSPLPALDRWWIGASVAATVAALAIMTTRGGYGQLPDALTMAHVALGRFGMPSMVAFGQLYPAVLSVGYFFGLTALAQALVLQRAAIGATWWIPVNIAAAFAGVALVRAIAPLPGLHHAGPYPPAIVGLGANAILTTAAYATYGAVTGVGLLRIAGAGGRISPPAHSVARDAESA